MPTPSQQASRTERRPLSVIITTFNEEMNVGDCIESALWADEILVTSYVVMTLQQIYYSIPQ